MNRRLLSIAFIGLSLFPASGGPPTREAIRRGVLYLIGAQNPDGSWWDFYMYSYHKPYGTAFSLLALLRIAGGE